MDSGQVVSVNIGFPRNVHWNDKTVTTAIFKEPVAGRVAVRKHEFDGDNIVTVDDFRGSISQTLVNFFQ